MNTLTTNAKFNRQLWVPFNLPQATLDPGSCQPLGVLQLTNPQVAKLSWLSLHYVRMLASYVPSKLNPALACVYLGLYGSEGALVQVIPSQPLAYIGLDIPGVTQLSPAFAPRLGEPDTYSILLVNNMTDTAAEAVVTGAWQVGLG